MRVKLKYVLPLVHMGLAAVLLRCNEVWEMATRNQDMRGHSASFRLLGSLDWPVLLIPGRWRMAFPWNSATAIAVTGLFWYWVAENVGEFRQRRSVLMFASAPLRVVGDLLLVIAGACFGLAFATSLDRGPLPDFPRLGSEWLWFLPTVAVQLAWFLTLIGAFGRDLIHYAFRKNRHPASFGNM
jgi:hypothetical protein